MNATSRIPFIILFVAVFFLLSFYLLSEPEDGPSRSDGNVEYGGKNNNNADNTYKIIIGGMLTIVLIGFVIIAMLTFPRSSTLIVAWLGLGYMCFTQGNEPTIIGFTVFMLSLHTFQVWDTYPQSVVFHYGLFATIVMFLHPFLLQPTVVVVVCACVIAVLYKLAVWYPKQTYHFALIADVCFVFTWQNDYLNSTKDVAVFFAGVVVLLIGMKSLSLLVSAMHVSNKGWLFGLSAIGVWCWLLFVQHPLLLLTYSCALVLTTVFYMIKDYPNGTLVTLGSIQLLYHVAQIFQVRHLVVTYAFWLSVGWGIVALICLTLLVMIVWFIGELVDRYPKQALCVAAVTITSSVIVWVYYHPVEVLAILSALGLSAASVLVVFSLGWLCLTYPKPAAIGALVGVVTYIAFRSPETLITLLLGCGGGMVGWLITVLYNRYPKQTLYAAAVISVCAVAFGVYYHPKEFVAIFQLIVLWAFLVSIVASLVWICVTYPKPTTITCLGMVCVFTASENTEFVAALILFTICIVVVVGNVKLLLKCMHYKAFRYCAAGVLFCVTVVYSYEYATYVAPAPYSIECYNVDVNVTAMSSRYHVHMEVTRNDIDDNVVVVPSVFSFPIKMSPTSFVHALRMSVDGVETAGTIMESIAAKHEFQRAAQEGYAAAVVEVNYEFTTYTVSATIPQPGSKAFIDLWYDDVVVFRGGDQGYEVPVWFASGKVVANRSFHMTVIGGARHAHRFSAISMDDGRKIDDVESSSQTSQIHWKLRPLAVNNLMFGFMLSDVTTSSNQIGGIVAPVCSSDNVLAFAFRPPTSLQRLPRRLVIVIDKSGSMRGRKLRSAVAASVRIVEGLTSLDSLNIVFFNHLEPVLWQPKMTAIENDSIRNDAIRFLTSVKAHGGTDLLWPVLTSLSLLQSTQQTSFMSTTSYIILLSDGLHNSGNITGKEDVLAVIRNANTQHRHQIHTVSIGEDSDVWLLQRIAYNQEGTYRYLPVNSFLSSLMMQSMTSLEFPMLSRVQISIHVKHRTNNSLTQLRNEQMFTNVGSRTTKSYYMNWEYGYTAGELTHATESSWEYAFISVKATTSLEKDISYNVTVPCGQDDSHHHHSSSVAFELYRTHSFLQTRSLVDEAMFDQQNYGNPDLLRAKIQKATKSAIASSLVTPYTSLIVKDIHSKAVSPSTWRKQTRARKGFSHVFSQAFQFKPYARQQVAADIPLMSHSRMMSDEVSDEKENNVAEAVAAPLPPIEADTSSVVSVVSKQFNHQALRKQIRNNVRVDDDSSASQQNILNLLWTLVGMLFVAVLC
eukprot:PhF_6_TR40732/c0_g1_i1/m.61283